MPTVAILCLTKLTLLPRHWGPWYSFMMQSRMDINRQILVMIDQNPSSMHREYNKFYAVHVYLRSIRISLVGSVPLRVILPKYSSSPKKKNGLLWNNQGFFATQICVGTKLSITTTDFTQNLQSFMVNSCPSTYMNIWPYLATMPANFIMHLACTFCVEPQK